MPFAERVRIVALAAKDLREHAVLERDVAVAAREAFRAFGYARHRVGVMVPAREDARARRRAERRRVHVVKEEAVLGQSVDVRRLDGTAVASHLSESGVVLNDEQDVGRAVFGAERRRPCRRRLIERTADHAVKCRSRLILFQSHRTGSVPRIQRVSSLRRRKNREDYGTREFS